MPTVEQVINKPLTGQEIKQIIVNKLAEKLNADTRLADYISVPAFKFRLDLVMVLENAVHSDIELTVEAGKGTVDESSPNLTAVDAHIQQAQMPPNEARVDAGLEVPVLTHDAQGRQVEKGVKYAKEQVRKRHNDQ